MLLVKLFVFLAIGTRRLLTCPEIGWHVALREPLVKDRLLMQAKPLLVLIAHVFELAGYKVFLLCNLSLNDSFCAFLLYLHSLVKAKLLVHQSLQVVLNSFF